MALSAKPSYLDLYLHQLATRPVRTKVIAGGALTGLQEFLAAWIADEKTPEGSHFNPDRVPKMVIYGAFVSAPLRHYLADASMRIFGGRTGRGARVLALLMNNLLIPSIQNSVFLIAMAIIAGARTITPIKATLQVGFVPMMKVSIVIATIAQALAAKFIPVRYWAPYFNMVGLLVGTYFSSQAKKKRLAAAKKLQEK